MSGRDRMRCLLCVSRQCKVFSISSHEEMRLCSCDLHVTSASAKLFGGRVLGGLLKTTGDEGTADASSRFRVVQASENWE